MAAQQQSSTANFFDFIFFPYCVRVVLSVSYLCTPEVEDGVPVFFCVDGNEPVGSPFAMSVKHHHIDTVVVAVGVAVVGVPEHHNILWH